MANLRRALDVFVPLALASVVLVMALPNRYLGALADERRCGDGERSCKSILSATLRRVSFSQRWGMYAPDPARSHSYMMLTAVDADGSERDLEENEVARDGWGTAWAWEKTRLDILRHAVTYFRSGKPNRNRAWFLRGICVREYRAGRRPQLIRMDRVRRKFNAPARVRAGKPVLARPRTKTVEIMGCSATTVQEMIAQDRGRGPTDG